MKKLIYAGMLGIALFCFNACQGNKNDSVEQAKESNEEKRETHEEQPATPSTVTVSESDSKFMVNAANDGMFEVEASKLAEQMSTDAKVKDFAKMMVTDHSKANDELKDLAMKKNVTLPTTLDQDKMDDLNKLKEKKGVEFDNAYIEMMQDDHDKDVKDFEDKSKNADDTDLKAWASKMLPTLRMHKEHADAMKKKGGVKEKMKSEMH